MVLKQLIRNNLIVGAESEKTGGYVAHLLAEQGVGILPAPAV